MRTRLARTDGQLGRQPGTSAHRTLKAHDAALKSETVRRAVNTLAIIGFVLPIVIYLAFICHYGVNMLWLDQWYNVELIGHPSLSALWAQHSEHRIFFPNLIVLLLAHTTHLNIVFEEFLSGIMLCLALGLLVLADKREAWSTPWIYYCPVAFVLLSLVQAESTLFGFQLAWYLSILALAVALFLLDAADPTKLAMTGAIAAAVIGSFSAFEGLFIWPVGLMVLYRRRCRRGLMWAWIAAAAVSAILYFHNYRWGHKNLVWLSHPITAIKFFFLAIGDVVGAKLGDPQYGNAAVLVLGAVIFAAACWVIVNYGFRRHGSPGSSIGVALVCFGLLFAITFTVGRVNAGLWFAGQSQYATFDLLILSGCYLAVIHPPPALAEPRRSERVAWPVVRWVVVGAIVLQILLGTLNGLSNADRVRGDEVALADVTANIDRAPDRLVDDEILQSPVWIRKMAKIAETDHLSLFATAAAAEYRKEGLFPWFFTIHAGVIIPTKGATLSGVALLDAVTAGDVSATQVTFSVAGGSHSEVLLGRAIRTAYGWVLRWNTTGVPNGTYVLRSKAYTSNGTHIYSPGIKIKVQNTVG